MSAIDQNSLKTAWKLLVRDLGSIDAVAACTRTTRSLAGEYGNINNPDRYAPVDVVLDAERVAGQPRVTEMLALLQGYALVPVEPRAAGELAVKLAEFGRDASALFATAATALSHDHLTADERIKLSCELADIRRVITEAEQIINVGQGRTDRLVPRAVEG
jgi:hypothetical protein